VFRALSTVLIAHAVAFALVGLLPKTGIAVLGIGAADPAVLVHYYDQLEVPRSYHEALCDLVAWNFGKTLDQVSAAKTMEAAIAHSLPLLLVSNVLLAAATGAAFFWPSVFMGAYRRRLFEFLTFVPAYLPGFLVLAVAVTTGSVLIFEESLWRELCLGLCIGAMPSCLSVTTIGNAYAIECTQRYVQFMRACGYNETGIAAVVRKAVLLYWLPISEKIFNLQLAVLIFTEGIFSHPGFGSMLLLAVQRTDVNLILASVIIISLSVTLVRLICGIALSLLDPRHEEERTP
jgi:ABC-type dipeptide/oligopeptide/nickel transport system permease component